ncbi:Uncharacterized protein OBRU01_24068 [Operophtera brumata]|uniref:Uncharacterized protein n=1 Tax=Operophtera brumata TaxID=104452 RepID=A0A0L7KN58_OPEBR|nr:Uncharacterized protein OBRU01_24068 [Operophtera brumata]
MSAPTSDSNAEDAVPEDLEEAGMLEADVGARFDQQLSGINPQLKIEMDPFAHRDLRPEMMFIREELRQAKLQTLAVSRDDVHSRGAATGQVADPGC